MPSDGDGPGDRLKVGWYARKHQGSLTREPNQSQSENRVGVKALCVAERGTAGQNLTNDYKRKSANVSKEIIRGLE